MTRLGAHVGIGGGLIKAAAAAAAIGCETMQIFSRSPRGGKPRQFGPDELLGWLRAIKEANIWPLVIHVPYFLNLASPEAKIYDYSVESLALDMERAGALGASYVVTHIGHGRGDPDGAHERVAAAVSAALDRSPPGVMLLLENTAGAGGELGTRFADLAEVRALAGASGRIGLCLDTCHAFGAGYDLSNEGGVEATLDEVERTLGLGSLRVVHANDSKGTLGSGIDRHAHIGQGHIGLDGFRALLRHPALDGVSFILETPVDEARGLEEDLAALKQLRGHPCSGPGRL